jgi:hypothetical protein
MGLPQPGIFAVGTSSHAYVEVDLLPGADPVAAVGSDGFTMPATQHDVALWFAAGSYDVVFDATLDALGRLAPYAALASELRKH